MSRIFQSLGIADPVAQSAIIAAIETGIIQQPETVNIILQTSVAASNFPGPALSRLIRIVGPQIMEMIQSN